MKAIFSKRRTGGFNFIDALIVVVTLLLFLTVALPWLSRTPNRGAPRMSCVNNLKQVGLAFRIWANDNGGSFPMVVSTNKQGTLEFNESGEVFRHFVAITNELTTPKILTCPVDAKRTRMREWKPGFKNQNLSYFVGLEADETKPQTILSGDRNITGGVLTKGNLMLCRASNVLTWTTAIHNKNGNIGLGDGSVQQVTDVALQRQLQAEFQSVTNEVIRLAIP
jgi:hypothetical protein